MIARYADFFALFVDFRGFIEFFLLQDAVTVDCEAVIFSAPFKDFTTPAIPQTITEYREYRQRAITFIEARNRRIASTADSGLWRIGRRKCRLCGNRGLRALRMTPETVGCNHSATQMRATGWARRGGWVRRGLLSLTSRLPG